MASRKSFLKILALGGVMPWSGALVSSTHHQRAKQPIVISTWKHGVAANAAAWQKLQQGGSALDAVEAGVHYRRRGLENARPRGRLTYNWRGLIC